MRRLQASIPPTYTIFKSGSTYYAESCVPGGTDYSDTDFKTVIENALATNPGMFQLHEGTFVAASGIAADYNNFGIRGMGRGVTTIDFSTAGAGSLFTLGNGTTVRDAIEISDMSLKGRNSASYAQTAINVDYVRHPTLQNLEIYYFQGTNMWAIEGRIYHGKILGNHFWNNANHVQVSGASNNTSNRIRENYFYLPAASTGYHVDIGAGSTLNRIVHNLFEGSLNRVRIQANNNVFLGNSYEGNAGAVDLEVTGTQNTIGPNNFTNTVTIGANNRVEGHRQSPSPVDLSGAAVNQYLLHPETACSLVQAYLLYTEASSADAGITLKIGKESDDDYYYTGTSETGKAQYYTKTLTLLAQDVAAGDTVIFNSAGGKTGTGEVVLVLEYVHGGS